MVGGRTSLGEAVEYSPNVVVHSVAPARAREREEAASEAMPLSEDEECGCSSIMSTIIANQIGRMPEFSAVFSCSIRRIQGICAQDGRLCGMGRVGGRQVGGRSVLIGGMCPFVHLAEMIEGDVSVNLSGIELLMAKKCLKRPQVGSVLQHQGSGGVANHVAAPAFLDANGV